MTQPPLPIPDLIEEIIAHLRGFNDFKLQRAATAIATLQAQLERVTEALEGYLSDCTNEECERCITAREALAAPQGGV